MASNIFIEIDIPEATLLADYCGIRDDLDTARGIADILRQLAISPKPDWQLIDPLWTALLVRYARPFKTGVRIKLSDDILSTLNESQKKQHESLIAIRDKHIAHSVNSFEENQPIARYWDDRVADEGISSISCIRNRVVGLSDAALASIIELINYLLKNVENRINQEEKNVLDFVRTLPYQDVIDGKYKHFKSNVNDPSKRRSRSSI